MINQFHIHPPLVIRVGEGHWKPPEPVTLETEWYDSAKGILPYRRFCLLMNDTAIYNGDGYGIERFGYYVTRDGQPPEIRLDPTLLSTID